MVNAGAIVISSLIKVNKFLYKYKWEILYKYFLVNLSLVCVNIYLFSDNQLCWTPKQTLIYAHVLTCRPGQEFICSNKPLTQNSAMCGQTQCICYTCSRLTL